MKRLFAWPPTPDSAPKATSVRTMAGGVFLWEESSSSSTRAGVGRFTRSGFPFPTPQPRSSAVSKSGGVLLIGGFLTRNTSLSLL